MKVLMVNGSPHEKGCTFNALTEIAGVLHKNGIDSEIFWIGNKPVSGCLACWKCAQLKQCVINDRVNECLKMAKDFDGFVFGSPVHFAGASGALTSFMDRLFYADLHNGGETFNLKPAAAVISARRAGTTATWDQINKYFGLMQMPIVTSRYWNMVHGGRPDDVQKDLEGMQTMRILGRNMAFLLKCKEAGLKAGISLPEQETPVFTNFIRE